MIPPVSRTAPAQRHLRRYENRKLYEPAERRYVTLEQVAAFVRAGDELVVTDQKTGSEITNVILAQVLFEQVKDRATHVPRSVLVRLVRFDAAHPLPDWAHPQEAAQRARGEAERIASGLVARGRLTLEEAVHLRQEIAASAEDLLKDAQRGVEARLQGLLRSAGPLGWQALKERLLGLPGEAAANAATATRRTKAAGGRKPARPRTERSR